MKKLLLASLCFMVLFISTAMAQNRTVSGTVVGKEDGAPLPGVSVRVKGTTTGTITDANGHYSISVTQTGAVLTFDFIGYSTYTASVGTSNTVNVTLEVSAKALTEVVVTALGASKEKKTLGYAQTTVKSQVINASSPIGLLGGLQGKVAGVTISNVSGSPGGSTKVILRGYSSITGSNQPLYVIDGVPFNNSRNGSDNNYDFGNAGNDIDPNIIDNISILKGSGATALYGSRGSNGVILITTKKGKSGAPVVEVNSGTSLTNVAITYTPQSTFGQGWGQSFILSENGSWGPKLDNQIRPWGATGAGTGATIGNQQLIKPFSFIKNNISDAFDKGLELNNNISVSGGNDLSSYFVTAGNTHSNGVLPGEGDLYKRTNFSLRGTTAYKALKLDASLNYVNNVRNFVATGQGSTQGSTFYENLLQIPVDVPIKDLRDYKNTFFNVDNYFTPYAENPYYSLFENGARQTSNRFYGNVNASIKANNWLTVNFQQSADVSNAYDKIWNNKNKPSPGSWNDGANVEGSTRAADIGSVSDESYNQFEYDSKLQLLVNKKISSDFTINGLAGVNYNDRAGRSLITGIEDLTIPGFFQINNSKNPATSTETESHRRIVGFYGQATAEYKDYLFLTVTGRNDITSTLAPGNNSYFYPGANLSYVISDALDFKSNIVTYAKLRASYGQTGSDTDPYNILNTLRSTNIGLGFGNTTFPVGGVSGYSVNNVLYQTALLPERVTGLEVGGEFRFLNDRINIDFTYYHSVREKQPLAAPISPGSGYTSQFVNFGKVRNQGIELSLGTSPVKGKNFTWDFNYTFSMDRSLVLELAPGVTSFQLNSAYDAKLVAVIGQPLGIITAPVPAYDPQGHIIVDGSGYPTQAAQAGTYGSIQPQFRMGFNNNFTIAKKFAVGFTVDYSQGGVFYSGTADLLNFVGADIKTTYNDRNPFIVPNSVQAVTDATGKVTGYVENSTQITQANITNFYYPTSNKGTSYKDRILTRTYAKLREVTIAYSLPRAIAAKVGASKASLSVFGRNLYTWLPSSNRTVDPEVSNLGSDLGSEFGEFRTSPPLRYFGASLKVSF